MEFFVKKFDELGIKELYEILKVRVDVFVVEQNCPYPELDGRDYESLHFFFVNDDKEIVSYLRIYPDNIDKKLVHIGRVLTVIRSRGFGEKIMKKAIDTIKNMSIYDRIYLEAQVYAVGFYEKLGFETKGEEFLEDGINHIGMELII